MDDHDLTVASSASESGDIESEKSSRSQDNDSDDSEVKDSTEVELERLVFGDTPGFKSEIKTWTDAKTGSEIIEDDALLASVNDEELYFLDSCPDQNLALTHDGRNSDVQLKYPAAWEDSDDDRMAVSLMSVARLRKLRIYEGENVVSGREYQSRLRRQFELLHPRPKWAEWTTSSPSRKRRRELDYAGQSGDDADTSNSDLESDLSTQPLAKLLRSDETLTRTSKDAPQKRVKFRSEVIAMERMQDIAPTQPSAITSISMHASLPLLISSGNASTLYLHHLQPYPTPPDVPNPLITSLHLQHTPLTTTVFSHMPGTPGSESPRVYLSSRRRYFHIWDLPTGTIKKVTRVHGNAATQRSMEVLKPSPCGRYIALLGTSRKGGGVVNILDANTTFWIAQVNVESRKGVADIAWWADGEGITVAGRGGEISEWSVGSKRIVFRWNDEGAVGVTTISIGGRNGENMSSKDHEQWVGPDSYVAIGSTSGIVNVYDRSNLFTSSAPADSTATSLGPKPLKTIDNLTTPISHLQFSPCGQLLVMASRWKRDALKLLHLPSCTVYRNWPTSKTPLGRISAVALGEYEQVHGASKKPVLFVGNEAGVLRGWEISG